MPVDPKAVAQVANDVGQFAQGIIGAISNIFGKDEVPGYDIKDLDTYNFVKGEVDAAFPSPSSIEQAEQLLQKAIEYEQGALAKPQTATNRTYGQMYRERQKMYSDFIANHGGTVNFPVVGGIAVPRVAGFSGNTIVYLIIGIILFGLYRGLKKGR